MRATVQLLAGPGFPGFWKRSLDEFRRLSHIVQMLFDCMPALVYEVLTQCNEAIKMEGLHHPPNTMPLWEFNTADAIKACTNMSDSDVGGCSQANLEYAPAADSVPAHALFSGSISNDLPTDEPTIQRTGYAAFRTRDRPRTLFGRALWDVERYRYLALRLKSDGRKYKVNIQTESIEYTDIHQYRIYARRPGSWETILIRWNDFVRTNHGMVVEPQSEMMKDKVRTIGIGLTDRLPGPFEIRISKIWATNGLTAAEIEESERPEVRYVPKHFVSLASNTISNERSGR